MATVIRHRRAQERRPARADHRPREPAHERPLWQQVVLLYGFIFLLAVFLTAACSLSASLAT